MKFSHSLQFNAVPEWSSKYIAYSNLKKLIYTLQRESLANSFNKRNASDHEASYLITQEDRAQNRDVIEVFVSALDSELKKIDKFYQEKEHDIYNDFKILEQDMEDYALRLDSYKSNESFNVIRRTKSVPTADDRTEADLDRIDNPNVAVVSNDEDTGDEDAGRDDDADDDSIRRYRGRTSSVDHTSRKHLRKLNSRSPDLGDLGSFNLDPAAFNSLADIKITLKKRIIALYTQSSELKSFIELNKTGFTKALKKFDKSLNTKIKNTYMENLEKSCYVFNKETLNILNSKINALIELYANLITNGSIASAKAELNLHLREHVVWERNTVWKDMIGLERKAQNATVAKNKEKSNGEEIKLPGDGTLSPTFINTSIKLLTITTITVILLNFSPFEQIEQKNCFAILVCSSMLWATETIPLFVTSLLVPVMIVVLGVLKNEDGSRMDPESSSKYILSTMWSSVIMLLLGGFTLAAALSKYNIARVISTWILSKAGTNPKVILLTIMGVALFVSMWVSNVAAPVLCFSIIQSLLRTLPRGSTFAKQLVLGIALASNIGGMASPIASPQNIISIGIMDPQPSWGQWFVVSIPVSVISLLLIWVFLLVTFKSEEKTTIATIRVVDEPFTRTQWFISAVTILTIILWCLANQLKGVFGEMGIISIIPMILFFGSGILAGEDLNNFLWTIVVLAMGGIALGKAVASSGLLATIAVLIQAKVENYSLFAIMLIFGLLILVVATFVSHTVAALIIIPLVSQVGLSLPDPHPNLLIMISAFLCSAAMGLPTSGFPNVTAISLVDDFGERYLTVGNFISRGVPSSVFCYVVIVTVGYLVLRVIGF